MGANIVYLGGLFALEMGGFSADVNFNHSDRGFRPHRGTEKTV